jgi:hypothetical protein
VREPQLRLDASKKLRDAQRFGDAVCRSVAKCGRGSFGRCAWRRHENRDVSPPIVLLDLPQQLTLLQVEQNEISVADLVRCIDEQSRIAYAHHDVPALAQEPAQRTELSAVSVGDEHARVRRERVSHGRRVPAVAPATRRSRHSIQ